MVHVLWLHLLTTVWIHGHETFLISFLHASILFSGARIRYITKSIVFAPSSFPLPTYPAGSNGA